MTNNRAFGAHRFTARRLTVLFVVNTVVLLAALGGLLWAVNQPLGPPTDEGLTLDGEALLKEEAARSGIGEGQPAPGFGGAAEGEPLELAALAALAGESVPLSDFRGRPVWVVFWATYCHACQLEERDMRRALDAYRADGLTIVAIDVGEDTDVVRRYAEERDLPWTILIDESGAAVDAFGAIGTPSHYFIAADGTIQSRAFGRLRYAEMDERLAALIDDQQRSTGDGSQVTWTPAHRGLPRRRCGALRSGAGGSGSGAEGTAESSRPTDAAFTSPGASRSAAVATLPRRRFAAKAATSTTAPGTSGRASRPGSPDPIAKPTPKSARPTARRIGPAVEIDCREYPVGVGGSGAGRARSASGRASQAPASRSSSTPATPPASAAAITVKSGIDAS